MNNEKKQIEFTQSEAQAVINFIDLAVKAAGLQVAEAAILISKKFFDAFPPATQVEASEKDVK